MDRNTRRFVTAAFVVAASCNVYDPSLLVGGGGTSSGATGGFSAASGKGGSGGSGGTGGSTGGSIDGGTGGSSGTGGDKGGSAGASSGAGGSSGGSKGGTGGSGVGGSGGSSGTDMGGAAGDAGGEAGMMGSGGSNGGTGGSKGGTGGTGGTSGAGAGGKGGTGGAGAGGAGAGGAGMGGTGGATTATGCAKLSTPLDASTDIAHFVITLPAAATDLTGKTMTVRTYVQAGSAGSIRLYVQAGASASPAYAWVFSAQTPLSGTGTWQDVTFSPPSGTAVSGAWRLGIEVTAAPATSGWTNPTIVYLDSVKVNTSTAISYTFDTTSTVYTTPTTADQVDTLWINNSSSSDTNATGTAVSWVATCP